MTWTKRIAPIAVAAAVGAGSLALPAMGATSAHWTTKQCKNYVRAYKKKHPSATKAQKSKANKTLKKHGCSQKIR